MKNRWNVCPDIARSFGERCHLLAELFRGADDRFAPAIDDARGPSNSVCRSWRPMTSTITIRPVSALQNVLTAVRHGTTVAELGHRRFSNAERHLKSPDEMRRLFAECPEAVSRTVELADRCTFSLDELRYEYPEELCPAGLTPIEHLSRLVWEGAQERYPDGIPDKVRGMLEYELKLVEEVRYEAYFLTVWDLVKFARGRDILCQGRGSAANSVICYCLGVTSVDPDQDRSPVRAVREQGARTKRRTSTSISSTNAAKR